MANKKKPKRILFLCTGNSCRSQMAEGWVRHLHGEQIEAWSAGIEVQGLNPLAVAAMKTLGVDISTQHSKLMEDLRDLNFDQVITVCSNADANCPLFPGESTVIHHPFDDPPQLAGNCKSKKEQFACYLKVCKEIRAFVKNL